MIFLTFFDSIMVFSLLKVLKLAQKETTNAGTKRKAPRTMMKAFWAQGDTYSAG